MFTVSLDEESDRRTQRVWLVSASCFWSCIREDMKRLRFPNWLLKLSEDSYIWVEVHTSRRLHSAGPLSVHAIRPLSMWLGLCYKKTVHGFTWWLKSQWAESCIALRDLVFQVTVLLLCTLLLKINTNLPRSKWTIQRIHLTLWHDWYRIHVKAVTKSNFKIKRVILLTT